MNCFCFLQAERGRFGAVVIGILISIGYVVGTSFLIRDHFVFKNENGKKLPLSFVDALYFNFVTLSTTGMSYNVMSGHVMPCHVYDA